MNKFTASLCFLLAAWSAAAVSPLPANHGASFDYPTDRNFLVLSYLLTATGVRGEAPLTEIYGDGTIVVSNMGEVVKVLGISPIEVSELVKLLIDAGILETTTQQLRKRCLPSLEQRHRAIALQRGEDPSKIVVTGPQHGAFTTISIRLAEYRPAGSDSLAHDIQQTISVSGLHFWSREAPEVKEISALKVAVDAIRRYQEGNHD